MEILNAVSKVRFNSVRPQKVRLHKADKVVCDLLCLEPKQEFPGSGNVAYYVVAGTGQLRSGKQSHALNLGTFAATANEESHTITNSSEQRLICLVIQLVA
jgi:hypothetical protein